MLAGEQPRAGQLDLLGTGATKFEESRALIGGKDPELQDISNHSGILDSLSKTVNFFCLVWLDVLSS